MITWYTTYNVQTGEILGGFTDNGKTVQANTPQGAETLASAPPDGTKDYYIDVITKTFIEKPPKPTQYHTFNWQTKQWEDLRSIQELRDLKWTQIKAVRDNLEFGGFVWNSNVFDSDQISQQRIIGAVQLANGDPNYSVVWTLANNTTVTLSAQDMIAVGSALAQHVTQLHTIAQQLREQINQAASAAELDLIQWPN